MMAKTLLGMLRSIRQSDGLLFAAVCLLCVGVATANWLTVRSVLHSNVDARFSQRTSTATDKLASALSAYGDAVHGASDYLADLPAPTDTILTTYAQRMRLAERLPGLVSVGECERSGDRIRRVAAYSPMGGAIPALDLSGGAGAGERMFSRQSPSTGRTYLVFLANASAPPSCTYAIADIDMLVHASIGPLLHDLTLTIAAAGATDQPQPVFDSLAPRPPTEPRPSATYRATTHLPYANRAGLDLTYTASGEFAALRGAGMASWALVFGIIMSAATLFAWAVALMSRRHARAVAEREGLDKRRSDGRLFSVIQSVREAIITIDEWQRIQIFNPTAESVFRCSAMEAIGEPLGRFIPERFRDAHFRHIERFGATGVSERLMGRGRPLWGLRSDGEEFPMEASISQSADAAGKFYTVVLRDVTEQRQMANALQNSRIELEKLNARLLEVREDEKLRIARELHDDLGQRLTALKMDAAMLKRTLDGHAPASADVKRIELAIDGMISAVRQMAAELRPPMLDDLGLGPAIEWYAQDFARRYGVAVDVTGARGLPPVPPAVATALFRIVQEAMNNVAKHARATSITIELSCDRECRLRISDNGRGLPPTRPKPDALGLISMRERARLLGGSLEVRSPSEGGTVVTSVIPLEKPPSPGAPPV